MAGGFKSILSLKKEKNPVDLLELTMFFHFIRWKKLIQTQRRDGRYIGGVVSFSLLVLMSVTLFSTFFVAFMFVMNPHVNP